MTTLLADVRWGVMVADTGAGDGDRQWPGTRKVWRSRAALIGGAGHYDQILAFLDWWRRGADQNERIKVDKAKALVLHRSSLWLFDSTLVPQRVESGREAIGTGSKAAMAAYEALWWSDPRRAVQIACKHDAQSRAPVRTYRSI